MSNGYTEDSKTVFGEVSSSNSIFEYDKLNWMNGQYIKKMDLAKLTEMVKPYLSTP